MGERLVFKVIKREKRIATEDGKNYYVVACE